MVSACSRVTIVGAQMKSYRPAFIAAIRHDNDALSIVSSGFRFAGDGLEEADIEAFDHAAEAGHRVEGEGAVDCTAERRLTLAQ
jgi:hypothetical protein